jgi:hypothetical protein
MILSPISVLLNIVAFIVSVKHGTQKEIVFSVFGLLFSVYALYMVIQLFLHPVSF